MKLKYIVSGAFALSLALTACDDQMNYNEFRVQGEDYVTRDFVSVGKITTHIYRDLDYDLGQMYGGASLCSATDEAVYSHQGNQIESYYNGAWSPTNANSNTWSNCWDAISYCNLYLTDFTGLTFDVHKEEKDYPDQMIRYKNWEWEVRFMRAYYYFLLARQYGDVPLILEKLTADEANAMPRVPVDSIFKFIDDECAIVKDSIIKDYSGAYNSLENEPGRVNNLGVLALRARAALYHASPLFTQGKSETEKKALWYDAALRAQECIKECTQKRSMRLAKTYGCLFTKSSYNDAEAVKEIIFTRRNAGDNSFEKRNFPIGMASANGGNCPTENLVSAYEMTNGLSIDDPASGYDPQNPYAGRDARLEATVAVNGEKWPDQLPIDALETWYGGANSRSITYGTPTGYYLKKYLDREAKISGSGTTSPFHNWVLFRLGQLYLDYAEAVLNCTGDGYSIEGNLSMTAAEAINIVRKRAGQPDLPTGLDKDAFWKRYERERFVELAFEGHRIYDVRRWMKAPEFFKDIYVMEITRDDEGNLTFEKVKNPSYITQRQWAGDHQYLWPIPQAEVMKSGALTQNPGWN